MADFIRGDCHKCKYETSAECVPRSQKMGFPNCYQGITTNADRIRRMTDEELASKLASFRCPFDGCFPEGGENCKKCWLDWLKQETSEKESAGA